MKLLTLQPIPPLLRILNFREVGIDINSASEKETNHRLRNIMSDLNFVETKHTKMSTEVNVGGIVQSTGINLPNIEKTLYSYFSALTGWIFAAFIDWRATVIPATKTETSAAPI